MKVNFEKLKKIAGEENVKYNPADLYLYGSDSSVHESSAWCIVRPRTVEQVQEIVRYANSEIIPIVPRGAGSGMSGQAVPIKGGIILDMKLMNRILEINLEDGYCRVEPGVVDDDLNRLLDPLDVFFPPTPASRRIATIGGEIANNASGIRSVKYGAVRDSVLGMKVVMANGDLVSLGSKTRVEASGYQLDRLMVGSEGTLGVIVEATLRFVTIPKFICLGIAKYDKLEDAGKTIGAIMASHARPSMLELADHITIAAVNNALDLGLPDVAALLFFEADGMVKESVDNEMRLMKKLCEENGGIGIELSYDPKERMKIFEGRKKVFPALSSYKEDLTCTSLADDMAVPYSRMADTACKIHEVAKKNNVVMTAYGHCGSGCMHTKILMRVNDKKQWVNAKNAVTEIYEWVNSIGGTTSAEHGIGLSKAPAFKIEKKDSLPFLKAIKKALDPNNIMNPGKMMDAPDDWVTATNLRYDIK
jgi:glycolate oxidase